MKLDNFYHLKYLDYCLHLCYIHKYNNKDEDNSLNTLNDKNIPLNIDEYEKREMCSSFYT